MIPNPIEERVHPVNAAILEDHPSPPRGDREPNTSDGAGAPEPLIIGDPATSRKLRELPKDVGVMLVAVGACGMILPGMAGGPAMIAGGLVLWPKAFGKVESWFEKKFPKAHREGMRQIGRYLDDLDRRYAYTHHQPADSTSVDAENSTPELRSEVS